MRNAKILLLDIETTPLEIYAWGLGEQHVGIDQIIKDWSVLSWCAKWLGNDKIYYMDTRQEKNPRNDKIILKGIWTLLDEADIVITQNGKRFDIKKLNARFLLNGMKPTSSFKHIDTLEIARSKFAFTSNKLAYTSDVVNSKYKKLDHKEYPGLSLWIACLNKDKKAWQVLEKYNKHDVLGLEEYYLHMQPWDNSISFNVYDSDNVMRCNCGHTEFNKNGFFYSSNGKYQRYSCKKCGAEARDNAITKNNKLTVDKRKSLKVWK